MTVVADHSIAMEIGSPSKAVARIKRLTRTRKRTVDRLPALSIVPWAMPQAGFYLWCHLPGDVDAADVARRCMTEDVILAPGNVFSVSGAATAMMRFNVGQLEDPRILSVLEATMARA